MSSFGKTAKRSAAGLGVAVLALVASLPAAAEGPDNGSVVDFSAPAEEDNLLDARGVEAPAPVPVGRAERMRRHEPEFRTFDTADGEDGQYWYHRTARPERIERSGSFTIVTLRTRQASMPDVTLVPAGVAYTSEAPSLTPGARMLPSGATVIDVEHERLDRRSYGSNGLDIIVKPGGPKIIRVSPDF